MEFVHAKNKITVFDTDNNVIAEVTFPDLDASTVNINHTFVDDSLRSQGIASTIMKEAVLEIRKQNKRALLSCTFAKQWFDKNPEYKDVLRF